MLVARRVEPATAVKCVGAGPALQHVVVAIADQRVVETRAAQILDRDEDVAGGGAGAGSMTGEVGSDTRGRMGIIHRVAAGVERPERSGHTVEHVGMITAKKYVSSVMGRAVVIGKTR